jgi:hypothetical protein
VLMLREPSSSTKYCGAQDRPGEAPWPCTCGSAGSVVSHLHALARGFRCGSGPGMTGQHFSNDFHGDSLPRSARSPPGAGPPRAETMPPMHRRLGGFGVEAPLRLVRRPLLSQLHELRENKLDSPPNGLLTVRSTLISRESQRPRVTGPVTHNGICFACLSHRCPRVGATVHPAMPRARWNVTRRTTQVARLARWKSRHGELHGDERTGVRSNVPGRNAPA